jgi:hypothetical protein
MLGDFNATIDREDIFKQTNKNGSFYKIGNDNKVRVVNFAIFQNLIMKSTIFPHHNINRFTWTSPNGKTHNKIDHILIDRKRHLRILDV